MKKTLLRILTILLYPLVSCYRIIQDAPIIDCDHELIGYGEFHHYAAQNSARQPRKSAKQVKAAPAFVNLSR